MKLLRIGVFLSIYCFFIPAEGHEFIAERELILDSSRGHFELLLSFREPPGTRLDYLISIYDSDHDQSISKDESLNLSPSLTKIAISSLHFSTTLPRPKSRLKYSKREGLSIALLYIFPNRIQKLEIEMKSKSIPTSVGFLGSATILRNGFAPSLPFSKWTKGSIGAILRINPT